MQDSEIEWTYKGDYVLAGVEKPRHRAGLFDFAPLIMGAQTTEMPGCGTASYRCRATVSRTIDATGKVDLIEGLVMLHSHFDTGIVVGSLELGGDRVVLVILADIGNTGFKSILRPAVDGFDVTCSEVDANYHGPNAVEIAGLFHFDFDQKGIKGSVTGVFMGGVIWLGDMQK